MKGGPPVLTVIVALVMSATAVFGGNALAAVGGPSSKHNMTDVPGYGFGGSVCAACHKPHAASGKRIWEGDKEQPGDGQRNLGPAKAASLDQAAGPGDYAGIYLCLDCHGGSSAAPLWSNDPSHPAAKVATHSTREMQAGGYATKYAGFVTQCTDCHETHSGWDGSFQAGENGYMIKPAINTPNSGAKNVVFSAMTGPGSMGPNKAPYAGICEVCHTRTGFHNNTGAPAHNDRKDCTGCHKHSNGFSGMACEACHGNPPVSFNTLVGRAANPAGTPTGAVTPGKHAFHARSTLGGSGYQCKACHRAGMGDGENEDKEIDVRFWAFGVSTSGKFDGFAPISGYTFSPPNSTGGTLRCSDTYCHGNFNGGVKTNQPVWNNAATGACGTCHATAPPGLQNHSIHLTSAWGPKAACDDCHPASSVMGRHATHVDGRVDFKDGKTLTDTTVCNRCHGCTAATKPSWSTPPDRNQTSWCEGCHKGSPGSIVNTAAGTGGSDVAAPDVKGDGLQYGFDVTGHGRTGIALACTNCHATGVTHIDGASPTYRSSLDNFKDGYRLIRSNTVPLHANYSTARVKLCYYCHTEGSVVGMPSGGKASKYHVHAAISVAGWFTDFRNMSTVIPRDQAGNYDPGPPPDIPTNIHWNHIDDYGSSKRGKFFGQYLFDSDKDGVGDSYVTCETCHNVHGTKQPAMVLDDFSLQTFSALENKSLNPSYRWLGSDKYTTTRCTDQCHSKGDAGGTAGTKWYREPVTPDFGTGIPQGLQAAPLP